jgi:transcriptional regulator with XRE-family HTH domain
MNYSLNATDESLSISPRRALEVLAGRLKEERVRLGLRLQDLSERSGVKYSTLRKFEKTGMISLERFYLLLSVLGRKNEIDLLARPPEILSLDELDRPKRVRGKRGGIL